jgi:hypothetical protein
LPPLPRLMTWMMAEPASNSDNEGPQSGIGTADSSFVSGEVSSFESIYRPYFDFVWSSVRRLGVSSAATDDVVQEVFIVIHSRLHTLEQPKPCEGGSAESCGEP